MITVIVQFKLPDGITLEEVTSAFQSTIPRYRGMAGLVRKYYLFDPATEKGGGCYLFESRDAAEALFNDEWRAMIKDKYGAEPEISYFETPVVVDNVAEEILA
jgi:hypothetical protein